MHVLFISFTVFMAQSKATVRGQRKGKNVMGGDAPPPQYHQSLLEVMLRKEEYLKTTLRNIPCGNMSQERMGQAPRGREEAMCNGDAHIFV